MIDHADRLVTAIARWNAGNLDGYLDLYDPAIRLHGYSPEPMDKAAVTGFYQMLWASFPTAPGQPPRLEVIEPFGASAQMCCRFVMSGVHSGAFMGVPATGRSILLSGITVLRFEAGRVVERWSSADMLGLLIQIGAVPPPG